MNRPRRIRVQNTDHPMNIPGVIDADIAPQCCACPLIASSIALVHRLDDCDNSGLTPDGAAIFPLCSACLDDCMGALGRQLSRSINAFEPAVACDTCGRLIQALCDIIEVQPL
jgi:hypothetical protein